MKVLLKQDVDTLGYAGEVHDVAPGYGRNYLIPQGMAVKATPGVLKAAETWRKKAEARREQMRREHEAMVERLSGTILTFTALAGEQGKLYGSITTQNIAEALQEELGVEIDRRKIDSPGLRQIGEHQVPVVLSRDYRAMITVNIHPEMAEEEVEAAEAEEAEEAEMETAEEAVDESIGAAGDDFEEAWEEEEYLEDIAEEVASNL